MYRKILVPLDGSPFGEQALPLGAAIARRAGAHLELVHVLTPLPIVYPEAILGADTSLDASYRARQQEYLAGAARRIQARASATTATLLSGEVALAVQHHAETTDANLVVMTTHGRGALGRFWLGSTADQLLRRLRTPLLLVRPHEGAINWDDEPALGHVLLPLDGTEVAEQMIEPAANLAQLMNADVTLLRVVRPVLPVSVPSEPASVGAGAQMLLEHVRAAHEELCSQARGYLEGVAQRLRQRGLKVATKIEAHEQPARAILEIARPPAIDLVALGTHGRGGLSRLLLGSVADKVVRAAEVPVLVRRPG